MACVSVRIDVRRVCELSDWDTFSTMGSIWKRRAEKIRDGEDSTRIGRRSVTIADE